MARKRNTEKDLIVSTGGAAAVQRRSPSAIRSKHSAPTADATLPPAAPSPVAFQNSQLKPSHEQIAELAYSYWASRGYQGGSPEEDWVRAENELLTRAQVE